MSRPVARCGRSSSAAKKLEAALRISLDQRRWRQRRRAALLIAGLRRERRARLVG